MSNSAYCKRWQRVNKYNMPTKGYPVKVCPGCGAIFQPRTKCQVFHAKACGVAHKYRIKRQETKTRKAQWRDRHAPIEEGAILRIPLSGRFEGQFAIIDNTPKNRELVSEKVFSCDHYGYPTTTSNDGRTIHLHHLVYGKPNGQNVIDHINGDKLDSRLCNLREVSRSTNNFNQPERRHNTSGKTGVYREGSKWVAQISKNKVNYNLGRFDNFEDAVEAREHAERLLYGHKNSNPLDNRSSNLRVMTKTANAGRREDSRLKGSKRSARRKRR